MTSILLSLDRIRITSDPEHPLLVQCSSCHDFLMLHQPDEDTPQRLLGTCPECRTWFLIDGHTDVMVKLPDENILRDP
jgi:hypothetical protein